MTGFSTGLLSGEELLLGGVEDMVIENRASGRRWARMVELHTRQIPTGGSFAMTAREWSTTRITEAWGYTDAYARRELNVAIFLEAHAPDVWEMCLSGALDHYRASTVADLLRTRIHEPEVWERVARRVARFLRRHTRWFAELGVELVMCTAKQLRNKLNYEIRLALQGEDDFAEQLARRRVETTEVDNGMGQLSITSSIDQVRLARHRLHAAAKQKRSEGDERTVEQLMSDLALDLLIGRAEDVPVPLFARPIINVTVPYTTLMGWNDDPATLSGGTVIPADLARAIATRQGSTWYRLLTDPDDTPRVLSTDSYKPTATIWRHQMAFNETCTHPQCDRPAAECELDHRIPWPAGPTSTENLDNPCRRHHKLKHARAELRRLDLDWEYDLTGCEDAA